MIIAFSRMDFSDWLQREMDKRKMSQADLARAAGMTRGGINNILINGRRPTAETCAKIARGLNVAPQTPQRPAIPNRGAAYAALAAL